MVAVCSNYMLEISAPPTHWEQRTILQCGSYLVTIRHGCPIFVFETMNLYD
ncbi:unnamed protein product, partial [Musa banksii]